MRHLLLILLLIAPQLIRAAEPEDTLQTEHHENQYVREVRQDSTINRREKIHQYSNIIKQVIRAFDATDTNYVIRPKYNWQVLMKSNYSEQWFMLHNKDYNLSADFASSTGIKLGPHLGWRFINFGYDFEIASLGNGHKYRKTEFNFSIYSTLIGADLFYRRTGSDFELWNLKGFDKYLDPKDYIGREDNGIQMSMAGINLYYVTNHKRYSQGSAFANSMREQKRSAGSGKLGVEITKHDISFNKDTLMQELGMYYENTGQYLRKMHYWDFSVSGGYAYNWVFARHWLFGIDVEPAIGYKRTNSEIWSEEATASTTSGKHPKLSRAFLERGNVNINFIGRAALAWNNGHYFGGITFVFYNFNYRHQNIIAHNTFFTASAYLGLNFMERKHYREAKARERKKK